MDYLGAGETPVSFNMFAYCNNTPVAASDPNGHFALEIFGIKITIELFALFCTCVIALVPLIISFLRDLPKMISYIVGFIQDLVDAVTLVIEKAVKAVKRAGTAKHHVIAQTAWRASYARLVWTGYGLKINDSRNLVSLNVVFHSYLHIAPYYEAVNSLVYAGTLNGKAGVISIVIIIRTLLASANRTYF